MRYSLAALAVVTLLGACTPEIGLFGSGPAPALYNLTPITPGAGRRAGDSWTLFIDAPSAAAALDNDRLAMRPSAHEMRYLAGARWADRLPGMLRDLLVESFENDGYLGAVTTEAGGLPHDFVLKVEIRDFQAEIFSPGAAPAIHVKLTAKILRRAPVALLSARNFEATARAGGDEIGSLVAAFDKANGEAMGAIIAWTEEVAGKADD